MNSNVLSLTTVANWTLNFETISNYNKSMVFKMHRKYSRLPITRTLVNSNLALTRTNFRFPSGHFPHNFTLDNSNLPLTRTNFRFPSGHFPHNFTLDNSNLPLTRTNFRFPSGHFPHNFTLDNSNHVCQYVTIQSKQCTVDQIN